MNRNLKQRNRAGIRTGIVGILSNLLLFIFKLMIGFISASSALIADAFNNLSDFLSALITVIGFIMGSKPADHEHPYGHERSELISGFVIALIMMYLGVEVFRTSILKIFTTSVTTVSIDAFIIIIVSIVVKVGLYFYYQHQSRVLDSEILLVNAKDSFNDVLTSLAILLGLILQYFFNWTWIDPLLGCLIAIYIIYASYKLLRDFIHDLLGARPSNQLIQELQTFIRSQNGIMGYHDLMIHDYGKYSCYVSVHVELDASLSLIQAHDIIDDIEREGFEELGVHLLIHIDPVEHSKNLDYDEVIVQEVLKQIHPDLKYHDLRIIHDTLTFDVVVPESVALSDAQLKQFIEEGLKERNIKGEPQIQFDRNYID